LIFVKLLGHQISTKMNLKKTITRFLFFGAIVFGLTSFSAFGDVPDGIVIAFKAGNAKELSKYFNNTIELVVGEKEGVYSKAQAEQIVKDFFLKNPVDKFMLLHEGGKEASKYAIGTLYTLKGTYRITLLIKTVNNKPIIHQLRIDEDNV
jgi:hypothetical protein